MKIDVIETFLEDNFTTTSYNINKNISVCSGIFCEECILNHSSYCVINYDMIYQYLKEHHAELFL